MHNAQMMLRDFGVRMDRVVELSYNTAKWKTVAAFVGTYSVTYLGMTLLSPDYIELWPHALMLSCFSVSF